MVAVWLALVLSVHDGDTFRARVSTWPGETHEIAIRVLGIDAPELQGQCPAESQQALKAREALGKLLKHGFVYLTHMGDDKYGGRMLASVKTPDGTDVGAELVKRGLAVPYSGRGPKHDWCK